MTNNQTNSGSLGIKLIDLASNPEQYSSGEAASWLRDQERQNLQRQQFWNGIKDYIPKDCESMLDVGCGIGWSAEKSAEIGIGKWVGIEPASSHYNQAKNNYPVIDIRHNTLESLNTDEKFDCVICIMIFSHIRDVGAAFKKISDLMNPDGCLIIVTSAFHEGSTRFERRGRKYEVYEIDEDQYVDKSISGGYGIADINRKPSYYINAALESDFILVRQGHISDSGYSPKDLFIFKKAR